MEGLNFREMGSGPTLILIHGFPLNQQIWKDFADKLSESLHVVTVDLPGFGKSPLPPDGFTIDDVAATLLRWIRARKYEKPVVAGHSLGGYIALAMAAQEPESMAGMCLFHSTALADSDEKKASRDKVLEFISKQGVRAFTSNFVSQLYADPRHHSITRVKNVAVQASAEAVTGYTLAMRERPDRTGVLQQFPGSILFLAGEKDQGIPTDSILEQARLSPRAEAVILPDAAHMGMFESEGSCLKKLVHFVRKSAVTITPGAV